MKTTGWRLRSKGKIWMWYKKIIIPTGAYYEKRVYVDTANNVRVYNDFYAYSDKVLHKSFKTKLQAIKFAKEYMRKN